MIIGITGLRNVNIRQSKAQFYITIGGVKKGDNGLLFNLLLKAKRVFRFFIRKINL
jgi:hypothetical protein